MLDGLWMIILLSVTMFIGSFISGLIPLTLTLSESKMRFVTIVGAGLLVGTALAVIIPEGVHTLYLNDSPNESHQHHHEKRSLDDASKLQDDFKAKIDHESSTSSNTSHSSIGISLVIGFVLMLVIDQIGGNIAHSHASSASLLDAQSIRNKVTFTTTLGLVIHAGVDGLALGAAASSTQNDIKMIVFIAIMLHKAPASFGLVSFLLHEGLDRIRARRHLFLFALAAPIMAILTYLILNMPNQQTKVSSNQTGLCMLFSAGTFLYVSTVHVIPEIQSQRESKQFTLCETCVFIFGAVLPLILSIGHSH